MVVIIPYHFISKIFIKYLQVQEWSVNSPSIKKKIYQYSDKDTQIDLDPFQLGGI